MQSRFDTEARIAVAQAADIARELGHTEVGPDHLLLGLLANARGTAYAALTDHGLRLDAAREIVAAQHVDPVDEPDTDGDDRGRRPAPTSYDEDREALRAIGIDLDRVRDAVRTNLGQDLSDGWASRPERGRRGGRGRRGRHHHHHDHEGRGRRGPRSRRGDGPRFSRELRGLLRDVRRTVLRDRLDDDRGSRRERARHVRRPAAGRADPVRGPGRAGRARRRHRPRRPAGAGGGGGHAHHRLSGPTAPTTTARKATSGRSRASHRHDPLTSRRRRTRRLWLSCSRPPPRSAAASHRAELAPATRPLLGPNQVVTRRPGAVAPGRSRLVPHAHRPGPARRVRHQRPSASCSTWSTRGAAATRWLASAGGQGRHRLPPPRRLERRRPHRAAARRPGHPAGARRPPRPALRHPPRAAARPGRRHRLDGTARRRLRRDVRRQHGQRVVPLRPRRHPPPGRAATPTARSCRPRRAAGRGRAPSRRTSTSCASSTGDGRLVRTLPTAARLRPDPLVGRRHGARLLLARRRHHLGCTPSRSTAARRADLRRPRQRQPRPRRPRRPPPRRYDVPRGGRPVRRGLPGPPARRRHRHPRPGARQPGQRPPARPPRPPARPADRRLLRRRQPRATRSPTSTRSPTTTGSSPSSRATRPTARSSPSGSGVRRSAEAG